MVHNINFAKIRISDKIYLRPCCFVSSELGKTLYKQGKSLKIGSSERFFTSLEVFVKDKNSDVSSVIFDIKSFKEFSNHNKNQRLYNLLNEITKTRTLLSNKSLFKKKKYYVFGILNVTPDSFSDGGDYVEVNKAFEEAKKMIDYGVDFIDIGGESTRPGAKKVNSSDEILRVLPIIQKIKRTKTNISLDTRNSDTMNYGLLSGVDLINDVSGLNGDQNSIKVISKFQVPVIIMHMPGNPQTMMKNNIYEDVILDLFDFFEQRINFCIKNGLNKEQIIIDPGIGFGKDYEQNIKILKNISLFHALGCPIMLGVSRKKFISSIIKEEIPKKRLPGSLSAVISGFNQGVQIMRVHDVKETIQALETWIKLEF